MTQNPYQTLGISPEATLVEARDAYLKRVRVLHPDRFDPESQKTEWELANQMLRDLNEAWGAVKNRRTPSPNGDTVPPPIPPAPPKRPAETARVVSPKSQSERSGISQRTPTARRSATSMQRIVGIFLLHILGGVLIVIVTTAFFKPSAPGRVQQSIPPVATTPATVSNSVLETVARMVQEADKKNLEDTVRRSETDYLTKLDQKPILIPPPPPRPITLTAIPPVTPEIAPGASPSTAPQPASQPLQAPAQRQSEISAALSPSNESEIVEFNRRADASKVRALELYPDVSVEANANGQTPLVTEMCRLDKILKETGDPLYNSPDKPFQLAQIAANNLGIAPRDLPASSPKPARQPLQAPPQEQSETSAALSPSNESEIVEFNRRADASKVRALELYPDVSVAANANGPTPLVTEMIRLDKILKQTGNELYNSPDKPFQLAQKAAQNLGIAPRDLPSSSSKPARQPPPPVHNYTDSSGNKYSVSDADYQRLFPIKSALDVESQNLDRLEAKGAATGYRIRGDRENLDNTDSVAVDNFNAEVDAYNFSQVYVKNQTDTFNRRVDDFNRELHRVGTLINTGPYTTASPTK